ncbi:MAG: SUMF1/EgtB/PvdO family nonheme iron enzyme [Victivallales bacterium]|nr:SUMF1/EgtB/PvdO family nonheme iron enzyme [Victivallales bacterium]
MFDDNDQTIIDDANQQNAAVSEDSERTLRDYVPIARRLKVGDVILGQYEVLGDLGQGGMGVVYRCLDRVGRIEVAVKSLPPELAHDADEMEAVRYNFSLVASLVHQNIAACRTLAEDKASGECYLVMEYVQGETLKSYLRRHGGKLSLDEALPILRQVAEALDFAHGKKVMHRDIKPGNIMLCTDGQVKVLDFGLAAQIRSSMSRVSQAYSGNSGTRQYKAPEQWEGRYQGAYTDQYALAVTAYETLSGNVPFDDDDVGIMSNAVLNGKVPPLPGLPAYANRALEKGLAKKPEERFANCVDFVRALGGEKVFASGKSRFYTVAGLALVVVLAVGLAIAGYYHKSSGNSSNPPGGNEPVVASDETKPAEPSVKPVPNKDEPVVVPEEPKPVEPQVKPKPLKEEVDEGLIEELYRTQARLAGIMKTFNNSQNIDKGQGFGVKLDDFQLNCNAGNNAMSDGKYSMAKKFYDRADEAQKWINKNLELRKEALNARKSAEIAQGEAEKEDARQWSFSLFNQAGLDWKNGGECFENAEFKKAKVHFDNAATGYGKAVEKGRTAHLESLEARAKAEEQVGGEANWRQILSLVKEMEPLNMDAARKWLNKAKALHLESLEAQAKAEERVGGEANWKKVLELANEMEALDKYTARKWRDKANAQLKPSLHLVAKVNGQEVNASVENETSKSPLTWKNLSKGDVFKRKVTYRQGNSMYVGQLDENVDWTGERKIIVHLKKQEFNRIVSLPGNVHLKLIKVEAGNFIMGSNDGNNDEVPHRVYITKDFWLGETEVTQEQYQAIMGENPSSFKNGSKYPVECVTWTKAMDFCKRLTERERSAGRLPDGYVYTLPTEAQWEYAARGGNKSKGYKYSGSDNLADVGWYWDNAGKMTHPVQDKSPNELGFYDMSGNVWEWCRDSYEYDSQNYMVKTDTYGYEISDPFSASGSQRVYRGGSWFHYAWYCRVAIRNSIEPEYRINSLGFRVALAPSK